MTGWVTCDQLVGPKLIAIRRGEEIRRALILLFGCRLGGSPVVMRHETAGANDTRRFRRVRTSRQLDTRPSSARAIRRRWPVNMISGSSALSARLDRDAPGGSGCTEVAVRYQPAPACHDQRGNGVGGPAPSHRWPAGIRQRRGRESGAIARTGRSGSDIAQDVKRKDPTAETTRNDANHRQASAHGLPARRISSAGHRRCQQNARRAAGRARLCP